MRIALRRTTIAVAATAMAASVLAIGTTTSAVAEEPGDNLSAVVTLRSATLHDAVTSLRASIEPTDRYSFSGLRVTVNVNGVPVARGLEVKPSQGLLFNRAWGAGVVSISDVFADGYDFRTGATEGTFTNRPISVGPNAARVRYGVDRRSGIAVARFGNKLFLQVKARYIGSTGRAIGLRKATIQVKRNGRWRTLKTLKLNSKGVASYRRTDGTKRNYRVRITTTDLVKGVTTPGTRKL